MFSEKIWMKFDNYKVGSLVYAFINVFLVGCVKSAACWCWTDASGVLELMFFPLIAVAGVMAIIAIKNLFKDFWDCGGLFSKLALLYMIVSFVVLAV